MYHSCYHVFLFGFLTSAILRNRIHKWKYHKNIAYVGKAKGKQICKKDFKKKFRNVPTKMLKIIS